MTQPDGRIAYSIRAAAEAVGVSEDTIRSWISLGWITPRYVGKHRVLIAADELRGIIDTLPTERPEG